MAVWTEIMTVLDKAALDKIALDNEITVTPLDEGRLRLDLFLSRLLPGLSRTKVQEMIELKLVEVNGQSGTVRLLVKAGDVIRYAELPKAQTTLQPVSMNLDILFEDDHVIVLNKAAGITVHPGAGEKGHTLVHGLLFHSKKLGVGAADEEEGGDTSDRPGIVHRLDKDTTGVMVVAKTNAAHAHLSKQFHDKTNFRQYVALLNGPFPEGDWVRDSYIHRDPRERTRFASIDVSHYDHRKEREGGNDLQGYRFARTVFKREAQYRGVLSLVSLKLHTGRTHQIRLHARDLGSPIIGDQVYGKGPILVGRKSFPAELEAKIVATKRQMLHAWILGFQHPATGVWVQFEAPMPPDFAEIVKDLEAFRD
jgi:23S rRNA pseudouridine1911/1915/1917 synthase